MSEERLELILNRAYYEYLEEDEAEELINYIGQLEQEKQLTKEKYKILDEVNQELQQENQQLKEQYNIRSKAYNNILLENASLHTVLDEIREYIEKDIYYCLASGDNINIYLDKLLQILDKVKENV